MMIPAETLEMIDAEHAARLAVATRKPSALELAVLFHQTYERLAPSFGYETRTDTRQFDPESKNGRLMVAVCGEILGRFPATSTPS